MAAVACSGRIGTPEAEGPNGSPGSGGPSKAGAGGKSTGGTGAGAGANTGAGGDSGAPGGTVTGELQCKPEYKGAASPRIWRLSKVQYQNAVSVVFNGRSAATQRKAIALPGSVQSPFDYVNKDDRFTNMAASYGMSTSELPRVYDAAESLSTALVAQLKTQAGSCLAGNGALDACMTSLLKEKGPLFFNRPLTDDEVKEYTALATKNVDTLGRDDAAAVAFQAMFAAPQFVFRTEIGDKLGASAGRLDSYELATALAFSLTDFPADEMLWDAASKNALSTPDQIKAHVVRLLGKLETQPVVARYVREHFRYASAGAVFKDPKKYPFHDANALIDDTDRFVSATLRDHGTSDFLTALLTSDVGVARKATAESYGLTNVSGADPAQVSFATPKRTGILMQPSWLVSYSDAEINKPVQRGKFVRLSVMCRDVPALPIGIVRALPDSTKSMPLRARLSEHIKQPGCAACHAAMDPLGLGFEEFDHVGRPRTMDSGQPVDASGTIADSVSHDGAFKDGFDMMSKLAADGAVQDCFVRHNLRFFLGRNEADEDGCAVSEVTKAFTSKGSYADLLTTLFTSDAFLNRKPN